jgi:hypothetical protein
MLEDIISSVNEFVEKITILRLKNPASNAEQWFFRGQKCSSWGVQPNIFRNDGLQYEHTIIDQAQRQNPLEFRDCTSNFEILTKLQHYGLGTRLLDVTLNPLVALFFATEFSSQYIKNENGHFDRQIHDGKVFYKFVNGNSLRDLHIRIALEIPFSEFGKSQSLEEFCKRLFDNKVVSKEEYEKIITNDYDMVIKQLQTNSFIVATNSNDRLVQQRGAFLFPTAINIKTGKDIKTSILSKAREDLEKEFGGFFIIPAKNKKSIRKELDFFNVNEATLFPELEHQMKYIQSQTLSTIGTVEEYQPYQQHQQYIKENTFSNAPLKYISENDIRKIITRVLGNIDVNIQDKIYKTINNLQILDWQLKESAISSMRRAINKIISEKYPPVEAKSKANAIVNYLLEVQ